ncbi:MAG: hypothetical protein CMD58_02725 [Gammaproteobacteria bacterium]|nr:hypothetical protein [Gammaproteobacteria bacterium]
MLLVLFKMTIKDQIIQVLKEARRPIKAREIARRFELHFNETISKREVNRIIHNQLKSKVLSSGFPRYTHSLIKVDLADPKEQIINDSNKKQEINNTLIDDLLPKEILLKDKLFKMLDDYIIIFHEFRRTKNNSIRNNCLLKLEEIIKYIISNKLNIDEISSYLANEVLIHKQVLGDKRVINFIQEKGLHNNLINNIELSSLNSDLKVLIQNYESAYSDFVTLSRKPSSIKSTFSDLINELEKRSSDILDLIVQNILKNNTSLTDLENNCSRKLYTKIENHQDIYNWINKKDEDHSIDEDSYEDRLKEFKILCMKVWDDGIVDEFEQREIDKKIKELNLDYQDANKIFETYNKKWSVIIDNNIEDNIKIDYINKQILFKNINLSKEELLINFINNLFNERLNHRSLEVDLLFENFEEFYE